MRAQLLPRLARRDRRHLDRVFDAISAQRPALPGLVSECDGGAIEIEMPRLRRQVGRLDRTAAFLMDDIEPMHDADVVAHVLIVAGAPSAVEIAGEGGAAGRGKI